MGGDGRAQIACRRQPEGTARKRRAIEEAGDDPHWGERGGNARERAGAHPSEVNPPRRRRYFFAGALSEFKSSAPAFVITVRSFPSVGNSTITV